MGVSGTLVGVFIRWTQVVVHWVQSKPIWHYPARNLNRNLPHRPAITIVGELFREGGGPNSAVPANVVLTLQQFLDGATVQRVIELSPSTNELVEALLLRPHEAPEND